MTDSISELDICIPELRYIYHHLSDAKRADYVKHAKSHIVECLFRVALNLTYNFTLKLTKSQIVLLKKHKKPILNLIKAKTVKQKKKILTNSLIKVLLKVVIPVVKQLGLNA